MSERTYWLAGFGVAIAMYLAISGDGVWLWHAMFDGTWLCHCKHSKEYRNNKTSQQASEKSSNSKSNQV